MGMFDYLNGEQIKVFSVAGICLPDRLDSDYVFFSGGNLRDFTNDVPYKGFTYNYGKDFNIIDFYDDNECAIIHIIRNGTNLGKRLISDISNDDLNVNNYSYYGDQLDIKTVDDILKFIDLNNQVKNAYALFEHNANREYMDYLRVLLSNKNIIDENKYKVLYMNKKKEDQKNRSIIIPLKEKRDNIYMENSIPYKFVRFGALLEGLSNPLYESCIEPNHNFVVTDDRLTYIAAYNQLQECLSDKTFIKQYFEYLDTEIDKQEEIYQLIDSFKQLYDKMINTTFDKSQFFEKYALRDIESGRYKDLYQKYDILPYKNFDYSLWGKDECSIYDKIQQEVDDELGL